MSKHIIRAMNALKLKQGLNMSSFMHGDKSLEEALAILDKFLHQNGKQFGNNAKEAILQRLKRIKDEKQESLIKNTFQTLTAKNLADCINWLENDLSTPKNDIANDSSSHLEGEKGMSQIKKSRKK